MSETRYTLASVGSKIDAFLRPLLAAAGFRLEYQIVEGESPHPEVENPELSIKFSGSDVDLLLANKAELLLALEQVTMEALRMPSEHHSRISFDANDYRMLRLQELRLSAEAAAEKVKRTGVPFRFSTMNSRERRVIHVALRNESAVRSESSGFGSQRQVVIYPAAMPTPVNTVQPAAPVDDRRSRRAGPPSREHRRYGSKPGSRSARP